VSWCNQKAETACACRMPLSVRCASAQVVVSLPSRAAQWHYTYRVSGFLLRSMGWVPEGGWRGWRGERPYIPCFASIEGFRHIVVSFPVSSQEEEPVACPRAGLYVQRPQFMFKALPLRQLMVLRNRGVRVIGSFNEAKVRSCLVCLPLVNE
jgi:hypothetical protein